jgi:hypothetical protein
MAVEHPRQNTFLPRGTIALHPHLIQYAGLKYAVSFGFRKPGETL